MKNTLRIAGLAGLLVLLHVLPCQSGTTYAWTHAVGYWTNNANWLPSTGNPGGASADTANITNNMVGGFTNILNTAPTNILTALTLSNGVGAACLIVTNNQLTRVSNLTLANGSYLELDNSAVISNASAFNWSATNGVIVINGGSMLYTTGCGTPAWSGVSNRVTSLNGTGTWNLLANGLVVGHNGGTGNVLAISGTSMTNVSAVYSGYGSGSPSLSTLAIANGAQVYDSGNFYISYNGNSNRVLVTDTGSLVTVAGSAFDVGHTPGMGNVLTIANGGNVIYTGGGQLNIGAVGGSVGNSLIITNGGQFTSGATYPVAVGGVLGSISNNYIVGGGVSQCMVSNPRGLWFGNNADLNTMIVTNSLLWTLGASIGRGGNSNQCSVLANAVWNCGGQGLIIGIGPGSGTYPANNNTLTINGGIVTNASLYMGWNSVASSFNNTLLVTNGGLLYATGTAIGRSAGNSSNCVVVTGRGSTLLTSGTGWGMASSASSPCTGSTVTVSSGGSILSGAASPNIGTVAGSVGNILMVAAGGTFSCGGTLSVGASGANSNVVTVNGGLLQAAALTVGSGGVSNRIANNGGIYQFANASPTLAPNGFGNIAINGGTVSFQGITNADVYCNQSTKPLDSTSKLAWSGNNTFCLNAATNLGANQAYTFSTAYGSTNFSALTLMNGATYRGGVVTIGNGGTLLVTNGVNTIASNLVMQSGATLALNLGSGTNGSLKVLGTANFNGANLAVSLGAAPPTGGIYPVISATGGILANFQASTLTATCGGTNYTLLIYNSGNSIQLINVHLPNGGPTWYFL